MVTLETLYGKEKALVYTAQLLALAFCTSGLDITPAGGRNQWRDVVTWTKDAKKFMLWYNTPDQSTHLVSIEVA